MYSGQLVDRFTFFGKLIDLRSARIRQFQYSADLVIGFTYGIVLSSTDLFKGLVFFHYYQFGMSA